MSIDEKLLALGISLPSVATPAAAYVMYAQSGNQVFLSGHIAKKEGKPWVGQLGRDLGRVRRIVKVMSLVNSTPDYTEQHLVTNGASELLVEVFGDAGRHARSAFGVAQIPLGACVEMELIAEIA